MSYEDPLGTSVWDDVESISSRKNSIIQQSPEHTSPDQLVVDEIGSEAPVNQVVKLEKTISPTALAFEKTTAKLQELDLAAGPLGPLGGDPSPESEPDQDPSPPTPIVDLINLGKT